MGYNAHWAESMKHISLAALPAWLGKATVVLQGTLQRLDIPAMMKRGASGIKAKGSYQGNSDAQNNVSEVIRLAPQGLDDADSAAHAGW